MHIKIGLNVVPRLFLSFYFKYNNLINLGEKEKVEDLIDQYTKLAQIVTETTWMHSAV